MQAFRHNQKPTEVQSEQHHWRSEGNELYDLYLVRIGREHFLNTLITSYVIIYISWISYIWVLEELMNDVMHMNWFQQAIKDEEAHGLDEKIDSALTLFDRLG